MLGHFLWMPLINNISNKSYCEVIVSMEKKRSKKNNLNPVFLTGINICEQLICFLVVSFSALTISFLIIYWQATHSFVKSSETLMNIADERINKILWFGDIAISNLHDSVGRDCSPSLIQHMRNLAEHIPNIRTIGLIKDSVLYCSSNYAYTRLQTNKKDTGKKLFITPGSKTIPERTDMILNYLSEEQGNGILLGLDGYDVYNTLALISEIVEVNVLFGDDIVTPSGVTMSYEQYERSNRSKLLSKHSSNYPYTLLIKTSNKIKWHYFLNNNMPALSLVIVFSVVSGLLGCSYLKRKHTIDVVLVSSIENNEFSPWLQPVFNANKKLVGVEVLIRWNHPKLGVLQPNEFIEWIEKYGLELTLTENAIRQVSEFFKSTQLLLPDGFHFAFNISPEYFENNNLVKICETFKSNFQYRMINLVLEVTERRPMNYYLTRDVISKLKEKGVLFSLDDFGTGYANFSYLKMIKFDYVKIDKSFVEDINYDKDSKMIINNLIQLAGKLKIETVAEGIETDEQLNELKSLGASYFQGYLLAKPMTMREFTDRWLM